jgi:predicted Fe-Mo cluster-binding NifX family protein
LRIRVAVASEGLNGLNDTVPQVFGRSPAFTIIDIENSKVRKVRAERNQSADAAHGAGPLSCTRLIKLGVNAVVAASFGPTVLNILKEAEIQTLTVAAGTRVEDAVQRLLESIQKTRPRKDLGTPA